MACGESGRRTGSSRTGHEVACPTPSGACWRIGWRGPPRLQAFQHETALRSDRVSPALFVMGSGRDRSSSPSCRARLRFRARLLRAARRGLRLLDSGARRLTRVVWPSCSRAILGTRRPSSLRQGAGRRAPGQRSRGGRILTFREILSRSGRVRDCRGGRDLSGGGLSAPAMPWRATGGRRVRPVSTAAALPLA